MYKIWLIFIGLIITCSSCIEEIAPSSGEFEKVLVVDGLLTNGQGPFSIQLSYTTPDIGTTPDPTPRADVSISDNVGNEYQLTNIENGLYQLPSSFYAEIGRSYKLKIATYGPYDNYESDFCLLRNPTCIDSIGFVETDIIDNIANEKSKGISLILNASVCEGEESYIRWTISEDWKIKLPYPRIYNMVGEGKFELITNPQIYCFDSNESNMIQIHSFKDQINNQILGKKVFTISTSKTNRFGQRYRATIKQYSISKEEYSYWNKLKESSQDDADLFGKQPFTLQGNIKCISNPTKKVLGYFKVAGVTSEQIYINNEDINELGLPSFYNSSCKLDSILLSETYSIFEKYKYRIKFQSFYLPLSDELGNFKGLLFTDYPCSDCELNDAASISPSDWIDD